MNGYLGEIPVNVAEHPVYKDWVPANWALLYIDMYGQIDGSHHKQWILDQVARILLGTPVLVSLAKWDNGDEEERFETADPPSAEYLAWVDDHRGATDEDGEREYSYDEGIAP
jgi:hypothetical protein